MTAVRKRTAVCGGGFCGIASVVMLKEEGIEPICFEKTDKPGGTWCYRQESTVGVPSIMPTTIINHSKELGALSNFPPDKELSNYMRHNELYSMFMRYATEKDALRHVRYNSEVVEVKRTSDYEETGRWIVSVKDTLTSEVTSDTYDSVLVCVGHINIPDWPTYKGQEKFKGKMIHTHSLKGVAEYENKNVVVVGMGCSGLDAAVEISSVAKQVYLSTRSGAHVFGRVGPRGYPLDYALLRRYITILFDILPINITSWLMENFVLDPRFNSRLYHVKPQWHIFSKDPVINDHIASKLLSGSVIQKKDVEQFTESGVLFDGDSKVTEVDVVIMATGYTFKFPFLEKDIKVEDNDRVNLYKCMWPPYLKHPTLAFIGFFLPFGPGFPLGELQCRWAAHVLSGKGHLPSSEEMLRDIDKRHKKNLSRYGPRAKRGIRVDYTQFMDEIAEQMGVRPNFLKILLTDPKLFFQLIFGANLSYQYRLQGPHAWEGAREAIMKCDERVLWPLKRTEENDTESFLVLFFKKFTMAWIPFV